MKYLTLLLFILVCCSCKDNNKKEVELLVKEWNGKEILFPDELVFTRFGRDTVSYKFCHSKYKIVSFVDSIGCISCKLQLPQWKDFMAEIDSLCDEDVPFVFFFQTKNVNELRYILKRYDFSYPVCIDIDDVFNTLNHFPDQMMFQSFLVDIDNRVKVIGNPIHNLSVKELYLKELADIYTDILPTTTLQPDSTEYHYGVFGSNEEKRKNIILSNTGSESFHIKGVTTSCDCMNVEYNWEEIKSNESAVMTVIYKAEEAGVFWRTITIYGNIPDKSITLDFWGTIK